MSDSDYLVSNGRTYVNDSSVFRLDAPVDSDYIRIDGAIQVFDDSIPSHVRARELSRFVGVGPRQPVQPVQLAFPWF